MTGNSVKTTNRIKILYTIPNFDTAGSGKVVHDLVKHIDKSKFEPHIACSHNRGEFFNTVKALDIPIHIIQVTTPYKPYFGMPFRVWKISKFFRKHGFDIIHSWHWSSDFSEPLAAKLANIPFVYTKKAMGWGNRAWRWKSQLSTKIIAINSDMLIEFFDSMSHKVLTIPLGINTSEFPALEKTYGHKSYKTAKDNFTIVSVANLVPVKGIEILLDAVKQLNDSKIMVYIVGDDSSDYAQNLKSSYASECVIFPGKQINIKPFLAMADLFVIPTKNEGRREGQPIAPIEAMLSGRIVLGSKISGIKEVLKNFPEQLFEPSNSEELKNKILKVMSWSKDEKQSLEGKMRNEALNTYDISQSIEKHENLYCDIVGL